jgi:hypothetical protein
MLGKVAELCSAGKRSYARQGYGADFCTKRVKVCKKRPFCAESAFLGVWKNSHCLLLHSGRSLPVIPGHRPGISVAEGVYFASLPLHGSDTVIA